MNKRTDQFLSPRRIFDLAAAAAAILLLFPLFVIISAAIKLEDRESVFFIQERVGKGGRAFRMYKFRSMVAGADRSGLYIHGEADSRITRVGGILRKTGLDELPQLFNVLKGEMSIIGPRPALSCHIREYTARQMRRLEVNPGITGWAQINGRNSLSWPERIEHDIWYIDNRSFLLDLKILTLTVPFLLKNEGVYAGREKFRFEEGRDNPCSLPSSGANCPAEESQPERRREAVFH